jgi:hypothetical protein
MCQDNTNDNKKTGACGGKGKCCKAFLTVAGKDQPDAPKPDAEQPQAKKCCGGCCRKKADQPKQP